MRQILHIDMNSYFATVEQQANPRLRGKPVAVLGSKAKRSIIVAASVEAKKFGVKTGTRIEDAPNLCPEIIFVHGEPRKYSYVTKKFIEIFEDFTDKVEIFSIDEAFLDVTKTAKLFSNTKSPVISTEAEKSSKQVGGRSPGVARDDDDEAILSGAINIAKEIKRRIRAEIGDYITCSVGISHNKFLAKLGSDMQKPDGLVVISAQCHFDREERVEKSSAGEDLSAIARDDRQRELGEAVYLTVDEALLGTELNEFCGIGKRLNQRLGAIGIYNVAALRDFPQTLINKEFGIAVGQKLKRMSYGLDSSAVVSWRDQKDAKSYSHSRTLNKDVTDTCEIKRHLLLLSEKVAKRMRDDNCVGKEVSIGLRFKDFTGTGRSCRIGFWTHDGLEIYKYGCEILKNLNINAPVRAIFVSVGSIQVRTHTTQSMLFEDAKNDQILTVMDEVNNRFGADVMVRASLAKTKLKEIVSGMGRKKF